MERAFRLIAPLRWGSLAVATAAAGAGRDGGACAVTVDGPGFPWASEPMVIAADERLWYMGSHTGKLGMVE